jgi:hypothetical protein
MARHRRFELQDVSRDILFSFHGKNVPVNEKGYQVHHRTCSCNRFRFSSTAEIVKSKTNDNVFYRGLMQCANAKTCPVCASKISERKANEMRMAFNMAKAEGLHISLHTFTSPHTAKDKIETLIDMQSDALSRFWRGAAAKRYKEKYGIIGHIRSFEVKYGVNGWHPHFHIIVFSEKPFPNSKKEPDNESVLWIRDRWVNCSARAGLSKPNQYGVDVRNGKFASEYITKYGSDEEILKTCNGKEITWDMADEMTKGHLKNKGKSKTPFEILSAYEEETDEKERLKFKFLFLSYAKAMVNKALLKWSRGLRSYFELGAQQSDEEIVATETDSADLLCHLTIQEWDFILKNNLRSLVLDLANNGGVEALAHYFSNSSILSASEYFEMMVNRDSADLDSLAMPSLSSPVVALVNPFLHKSKQIEVKKDWFERNDEYLESQKKVNEFFELHPEILDEAQNISTKNLA